jgi:hypothetical protein
VGTSVIDQLQTRAAYWDDAAAKYDHNFAGTLMGQTRRHSVWRDLERAFRPIASILCVEDLSAVARNLARLLKPGESLEINAVTLRHDTHAPFSQ